MNPRGATDERRSYHFTGSGEEEIVTGGGTETRCASNRRWRGRYYSDHASRAGGNNAGSSEGSAHDLRPEASRLVSGGETLTRASVCATQQVDGGVHGEPEQHYGKRCGV